MPALSRRSFVTLTALASSSILLSPRAFAGSGATSAAGKPQETFLDFNESPYGPSAKARAAMQQAAALCGRYDYDAQDALVGLFAKQNGIPAESVHAYCGSRQPLQYAVAAFTGRSAAWSWPIPPTTPWSAPPRPRGEGRCRAAGRRGGPRHRAHARRRATRRRADLYLQPEQPDRHPHPARADRQGDRTQTRAQRGAGRRGVYPFSDAPSVVGLAVQRQDVLVLRTFSKLYGMAGARLGLAIGHPQLLARLERFGGHNVVPRRPPTPGWKACVTTIWCHGASSRTQRSASAPSPGCASRASAAPPRSPTVSWWICAVPPSWSSPNWRNSGCTLAARGPPGPTGSV